MTADLRVAYMGKQTGEVGKVIVAQNAMQFQIGTHPGDQVGVAIDSTHSTRLGRGIDNQSGFNSLAEVNVFTPQAAEDTIGLSMKPMTNYFRSGGNWAQCRRMHWKAIWQL